MKKIIFGGIAIVAIAVAVAFCVTMKATDYGLSDLTLSNAEALANPAKPWWYGIYDPKTDSCGDSGDHSVCDKRQW